MRRNLRYMPAMDYLQSTFMCLWQTYFQIKDPVFLDVTSHGLARTNVLFLFSVYTHLKPTIPSQVVASN